MAFATASSAQEPLSAINTTPLIDVLLVLLIVLVMAVPLATNSLEIKLPGDVPPPPFEPHRVRNVLVVETDGGLLWNGRAVSDRELAGQLSRVRGMSPEPEVQFRPDANASYARSAEVLRIVKQARIGNFGFLGNEQYRTFGR